METLGSDPVPTPHNEARQVAMFSIALSGVNSAQNKGSLPDCPVSRACYQFFQRAEGLGKSERAGNLGIVEIFFGVAVGAAAIGVIPAVSSGRSLIAQKFPLRGRRRSFSTPLTLLEDTHVGTRSDDSSPDQIPAHHSRDAEIATRSH